MFVETPSVNSDAQTRSRYSIPRLSSWSDAQTCIQHTDTTICTEFGEFYLRVYNDHSDNGTLVLWSMPLDKTSPVLLRVHSECVTGDVFGSCHCDCGLQLRAALKQVSCEGGVIVYLRQEGRGIGLFDKIRAYQLQSQGYDTHEANLLLGHPPDARTYEMVKIALSDLGITKVRLLTNNPSKISDIAKFGIEITERVSLLLPTNAHNSEYMDTKRIKFQHLQEDVSSHFYLYQATIEVPSDALAIGEFVEQRLLDPLMRVGVGISACTETLSLPKEIARIRSIYSTCARWVKIVPILHLSFAGSKNPFSLLEEVKLKIPEANWLQINDLPNFSASLLQRCVNRYHTILPVSHDTIHRLNDREIQTCVVNNHVMISIDNSLGQGRPESVTSLSNMIDQLLALGINRIGLAGGFGPNELDRYFKLKRHYRINLSVDAESRLRTNGTVDHGKLKTYFRQLIRSDDPKHHGISQTRAILRKSMVSEPETVNICGHSFVVAPRVFNAKVFPSTAWFAKQLLQQIDGISSFCEVGCGAGIISCILALENPTLRVVATDIQMAAVRNTTRNVERFGLKDQVITFSGDVLDGIPSHKVFEAVFWALPFGYLDPGTEITMEERQTFDPGYQAVAKLFTSVGTYLTQGGRVYLGFSPELGHRELLDELAKENAMQLESICRTRLEETSTVTFEILRSQPMCTG